MTQDSDPAASDLARKSNAAFPIIPATGRPWRLIPAFERNEELVSKAQTTVGRVVISLISYIMMYALAVNPLPALLACICAYTGRYRWSAIAFSTLIISLYNHFWVDLDLIAYIAKQEGVSSGVNEIMLGYAATAAVIVFCWTMLRFWPGVAPPVSMLRSTILTMSMLVSIIVFAQSPVCHGELRVILWALILAFIPYFWFLGYALSDSGTTPRIAIWQRLSLFHPFWGSSNTPFGKMQTYLQKFDAKSAPELAVTQIKGLKLLTWTVVAYIVQALFKHVFYTTLHIPIFENAFRHFCDGQ
ncbi:MAG: hypothetical protein RIR97_1294, partial [Pseudomonadota bacterium]